MDRTFTPADDVLSLVRQIGTPAAARELAVSTAALRTYLTGDSRPTTRQWIEAAAAAVARRPTNVVPMLRAVRS